MAAAAAAAHQEVRGGENMIPDLKKISEKENKYIALHPPKINKRAL